jgi:hypothetical protein
VVVLVVVFVDGFGVLPPLLLKVNVNAAVAVALALVGVGKVIALNAPVVVELFQCA